MEIERQYSLMVAFLIIVSAIVIPYSDYRDAEKKERELFNACLKGCTNYEEDIPYNNLTTFFLDYCTNKCNDEYNSSEEKWK